MKQILIVEDDSFLNKMLAYNLTADGYGVTSALNARTAADAIRQREFDLVLLDINLPDGNGFELCKLIKPQHPDTIVIFLTANDQESDQIRGYEVGAVDYITKPFVIGAFRRLPARTRRAAMSLWPVTGDTGQRKFLIGVPVSIHAHRHRFISHLHKVGVRFRLGQLFRFSHRHQLIQAIQQLGCFCGRFPRFTFLGELLEPVPNTAGVSAAECSGQLPQLLLDEYPMPDPVLTQDDLEKCGCLDSDLLPLSKERAYELMERDLTVYIIQEGENPAMAFDTADLDAHDGIFAVSREEWEESPEFDKLVKDRMDHQEEREQAFLAHKGDCFAIYQVKHTDELRDIRYEGLEWLQSIGRTVQRDNYELVYTAPLLPSDLKGDTTEQLFYRFNNEHPADYGHPSMSVSDIVAIKRDGKVSCHYCDSFGFQQVPGFLPDNPLKNAEMMLEDDYGMIDGIINNGPKEPTVAQLEQQARSGQPISLMDLAAAAHREDREKKKSVMEQLKSQPKAEHKKTAPKKSAEREI